MMRIPVADRRTALVQAALRVIARDGVSSATTRRIVAEADMSLASFHYVFESRDELMVELVNAVVAGEQSDLAPAFDPGAPPADLRAAIRSGLAHYFAGVRADPDREKAMFELTQWALREPGLQVLARRQYERYYAVAERTASEAAALTGVEWRRPLAEVARILVVLTDGITVAWLVTRDDAAAEAGMDFAADALAALAEPADSADASDAAGSVDTADTADAADTSDAACPSTAPRPAPTATPAPIPKPAPKPVPTPESAARR